MSYSRVKIGHTKAKIRKEEEISLWYFPCGILRQIYTDMQVYMTGTIPRNEF